MSLSSGGQQAENGRSDLQLKFIGFLLACALGILGWGFNNWSSAVESGMDQVMDKLNRIESRAEQRDDRINEHAAEIRVLTERQKIIQERLRAQEGHQH